MNQSRSPARFSVEDELSHEALGEGFSFGIKKPPRPGQFSERPRNEPLETGDRPQANTRLNEPEKTESIRRTMGPRRPPLALDELSLPAQNSGLFATPPLRRVQKHELAQPNPQVLRTPIAASASRRATDNVPSSAQSSHKSMRPSGVVSDEQRGQAHRAIIRNLLPEAIAAQEIANSPLTKEAKERENGERAHQDNGLLAGANVAGMTSTYFQTPEKIGVKAKHIQKQSSPTSTCGDLEGLVHRSPAGVQHKQARGPALLRGSSQKDGNMVFRHRSQSSQASNISRKRDERYKQFTQADADRKKMAMHQVAQYWNECIEIGEAEKNRAHCEIKDLQGRLKRRDLKLTETCSLLAEKQREIEDMEVRLRQLEERESQAGTETERLREQLAESNARNATIKDKHRQIREKLNEAIQEHQALYKRSQAFYEKAMSEMKQENEQYVSVSKQIDEALEKGRQKREEMGRCMQEMREQAEREGKLKEDIISELRQSIAREKSISDALRQQIEARDDLHRVSEGTASKVESLLELCAEKCHEQRSNTDIVHSITERVVSAIGEVASNQQRGEQALFGMAMNFAAELDGIKKLLHDQNDQYAASQAFDEEDKRHLRDILGNLASNVQQAQGTCQKIDQVLEEQFQHERLVREEFVRAGRSELDQRLDERDERLLQLEQRMQLNLEGFATKIDAITKTQPCDGELKQAMDGIIAEFQAGLESGFLQERERSEGHLRQQQTSIAALKSQLQAVNDHLAVIQSLASSKETASNSHGGRSLVTSLQNRIKYLEDRKEDAEKLREKWQQDMTTVGILRGQLSAIQSSMSQMEMLEAKLERAADVNNLLHTTAKFFAHEEDWMCKQLDAVTPHDCSDPHDLLPEADHAVPSIEHIYIDSEATDASNEADASGRETATKDAAYRRRVTVHSPAGVAIAPSCPPSVAQEQLRRREAVQPRSILKLSAITGTEPTRSQGQAMGVGLEQTGSDWRVPSKSSVAMASAVVEQIRAEQILDEASRLAWSLPTVADYERGEQASSADYSRSFADKAKRQQSTDPDSNVDTKRRRMTAPQPVQSC